MTSNPSVPACRSRGSRVDWTFPFMRLVQGVELWLPLADAQRWILRSLRVKACGVRLAVRTHVDVELAGVRIHIRPPKGCRYLWFDHIALKGDREFELEPALTIAEPKAFGDLRAALVGRERPFWLSVGNGQGYGDLVHCLLCQWVCFRLMGVDLEACKGVALLMDESIANDREKHVDVVAEFLRVGEVRQRGDAEVCAIKGVDVYACSLPLPDRIGLLLDDFARRLVDALGQSPSVPVSGGVRLLELLLEAFGSSLRKADRWPRFARGLGEELQGGAVPLVFPQRPAMAEDERLGVDVVVCQQRLGDLAVVTIEGLELVPWFVEQEPERYFQVLAAQSSRARRPASSLEKLRDYARLHHPQAGYQLITDGYGLAERLLLKPVNLRWIAGQLERREIEVERLIRGQTAILRDQLLEQAERLFGAGAVIGDSAQADLDSLHALQSCSACVSTSGHLCFSILNYLSRRSQVLHSYPMGRRFDVLRKGLSLKPLSPEDLQS